MSYHQSPESKKIGEPARFILWLRKRCQFSSTTGCRKKFNCALEKLTVLTKSAQNRDCRSTINLLCEFK
jgi:hypothetical protein